MRWVKALRDERGFTIQEVLVVLFVGSLVVGFGLSLFQFSGKLLGNWNKRSDSRAVVNSICQEIAYDIQHSHGVREITDTSLVLKYSLKQHLVLRFNNRGVWRNDVSIGDFPGEDLCIHFTVDSAGFVRGDIVTRNVSAGLRVLSPWSSRWKFEQSSVKLNATAN